MRICLDNLLIFLLHQWDWRISPAFLEEDGYYHHHDSSVAFASFVTSPWMQAYSLPSGAETSRMYHGPSIARSVVSAQPEMRDWSLLREDSSDVCCTVGIAYATYRISMSTAYAPLHARSSPAFLRCLGTLWIKHHRGFHTGKIRETVI